MIEFPKKPQGAAQPGESEHYKRAIEILNNKDAVLGNVLESLGGKVGIPQEGGGLYPVVVLFYHTKHVMYYLHPVPFFCHFQTCVLLLTL